MSSCCSLPSPASPAPAEVSSASSTSSHCAGTGGHRVEPESFLEWAKLGLLVLLSGVAMTVNLAISLDSPSGTSRLAIHACLAVAAVIAFALGCGGMARAVWQELREGRLGADALFVLGILASLAVSIHSTITGHGNTFYEVPILLPAIRQFGAILLKRQRHGIEAASRELTTDRRFIDIREASAAGGWKSTPLAEVQPGAVVRIQPGEPILIDGVIVQGEAYVQTRPLTGEPFPIPLKQGEQVSAGMIALDGTLEVRVTSLAASTELGQISENVARLLNAPPPFLRSAEAVLKGFIPAVAITAIVSGIVWARLDSVGQAVQVALSVVLVACPCAFGVALPLVYRRGLHRCLLPGIVPQDGSFLEALSRVSLVAFDKTGTLTSSEMQLQTVQTAPSFSQALAESILVSLSHHSNHPVARPFWSWKAEPIALRSLSVVPGRGVQAEVNVDGKWQAVRLGNRAFLSGELPPWSTLTGEQRALFLEVEGRVVAACGLAEELRPTAGEASEHLRASHYKTALLTGDGSVAPSLRTCFPIVHTSMRPEEKKAFIEEQERSGVPTLLIGDGLNDVSAFTASTASISVGESTPLAIATAQAHWPDPDYEKLPLLLSAAKAVSSRARRILLVAISYNSVGIAFAVAGLLHPAVATVVMMISSATVTQMAMRPLKQAD